MPLHRIYHPSSGPLAFTPSEKEALSRRITEIYTERAQLPAFYVVVLFIPIEEDSLFVGGEKNDKFVRIHIQHMARQFSNQDAVDGFFARYEEALEPFIKAKGLDWEVSGGPSLYMGLERSLLGTRKVSV
jgi:phenylpyruvate tautomerase PptA (4-oxalocrotonate tautomerase family)